MDTRTDAHTRPGKTPCEDEGEVGAAPQPAPQADDGHDAAEARRDTGGAPALMAPEGTGCHIALGLPAPGPEATNARGGEAARFAACRTPWSHCFHG